VLTLRGISSGIVGTTENPTILKSTEVIHWFWKCYNGPSQLIVNIIIPLSNCGSLLLILHLHLWMIVLPMFPKAKLFPGEYNVYFLQDLNHLSFGNVYFIS
jgi:hypothetical protein